ncbi:MAG: peptidylprolyl isomerase [Gemmataceae bacterium]|nr:peptidylprolyl isomerase [Gemmataceae bacterium]
MPRRRSPNTPRRPAARLACERLEEREVPAVLLRPIFDPAVPGLANISNDKPTYLPVTVTNTPAGAVTTTVASNNAGVKAEIVSGGRSIRLDVTGTDRDGVPFSGSLTIRLFETAAPQATQRLVDLVNSGFYANKLFHRIIDNFVIQGGSPNGDGQGGSPLPDLPDEYNRDFTFSSYGVVAMANAGDDNNDSQFFITDIDQPLSGRPQNLNFNHSIVGLLTDGFDTFQKIITTNAPGSSPTNPVTIVGAAVFQDQENAVVKLTPQNGFTGTAGVTVTANDGTGPTTQTVTVTSVDDGVDSKPFITTPVPDQTTTAGKPVSFTVPTLDVDGNPVTVVVRGTARDGSGTLLFTGNPTNVTATVDANGRVTITPNANFTGTAEFAVGVRQTSAGDTRDNYDTQLVRLRVDPAPATDPGTNPNPNPNTGPVTVVGSAPGTLPTVTIRNADGSVRSTVKVFEDGFLGGVRAAVADLDGDGDQDVVATAREGGAPALVLIDPATGQVVRRVMVFEPTFRGGLYLRLADVVGLGYAQALVGAGDTGGPRVTLLDLKRNVVLQNFFAGDDKLRGGVSVDAGKVFASKGQTIVTALGPGAGPVVGFFDPNSGASMGTFVAGDGNSRAGIRVSTGTAAANGVQPVLVAPVTAPDGVTGQSFDAGQFVDPDRPAATNPTANGGSNIDLSSLFPGQDIG